MFGLISWCRFLDFRYVYLLCLLSFPSGPAEGADGETCEGDRERAEQKLPAPEGTIRSHHPETSRIHWPGRSTYVLQCSAGQCQYYIVVAVLEDILDLILDIFWISWCGLFPLWSKMWSVSLQLINDKKALSERCEGVVGELKQVDQKYTKKIAQMQEQHEMVRWHQ